MGLENGSLAMMGCRAPFPGRGCSDSPRGRRGPAGAERVPQVRPRRAPQRTPVAPAHELVPAAWRRERGPAGARRVSFPVFHVGRVGHFLLFPVIISNCGGVRVRARWRGAKPAAVGWRDTCRRSHRSRRGAFPVLPRPGARGCRRGDGAAGGDGVLPLP